MEGIDETFDMVFFVGYHARAGADDAVLNHTIMGGTVYEIRCNGEPVDEAAINAGIAGHFGVSIGLVAGDHVVCREASERFEGVQTAAVKEAIDRYTANSLAPEASNALIRENASAAVKKVDALVPYQVPMPVRFEVDFKDTPQAHVCELFPQFERLGSRTIGFGAEDYVSAFKLLWGSLILAMTAGRGIL